MALYIDFNFINIRDLIDLSEVDSEFEDVSDVTAAPIIAGCYDKENER